MTYQFKIQIKDIQKPPVWRRVLVPDFTTLDAFHEIIQVVFGWENYHLYQFSSKGWGSRPVYKVPDPQDYGYESEDSRATKLSEVFTDLKQTFTYIYDFGDGWIHHITLEKILEERIFNSKCVDGKGACPPEDCGGPWGYLNLKETLANPKHPDYKDTREWLGLGKGEQLDIE